MNQKQALFVSEYLKTGNATQAYMSAYGQMDEAAAAANASRLIRNDKVQKAIQEHQKNMQTKTGITIEQVVKRIARLAAKAEKDGDKLKALDMLMKHLGGYVTLGDIIEKMTPEQLEQLSQKIVNQVKDNEK